MTHIVRPGESLGDIASQYGTTVVAIMRLNGIRNPNLLYAGQAVRIPRDAAYPMGQHAAPGSTAPMQGYAPMGHPASVNQMGGYPGMSHPGPGMEHPAAGYPGPGMEHPAAGYPGMPGPYTQGPMPGMPMGTMTNPYGTHATQMYPTSAPAYGSHEHNPHTARLNEHHQRLDDLEHRVSHLEARVRQLLH